MILTALAVAGYAYDAGFTGNSLAVAVAVAHAESGFSTAAVGDVNLTEAGERSTGLWQINWRPSRDQPGGLRDPTLNLDPAHCAVAAWIISAHGADFKPWSTFTSGAYMAWMGEAVVAVNALILSKGVAMPTLTFVPAPDGAGYWIFASDGAVYAFGSAQYHGRVHAVNNAWEPE